MVENLAVTADDRPHVEKLRYELHAPPNRDEVTRAVIAVAVRTALKNAATASADAAIGEFKLLPAGGTRCRRRRLQIDLLTGDVVVAEGWTGSVTVPFRLKVKEKGE